MKTPRRIEKVLTNFMSQLTKFAGHPYVFAVVISVTIAWLISGFFIEYDTWFDIMDVTIFITTFLLLFIVQSTQNADTKAMQDKLDEILDSLSKADKSKEGEEEQMKRGDKKQ